MVESAYIGGVYQKYNKYKVIYDETVTITNKKLNSFSYFTNYNTTVNAYLTSANETYYDVLATIQGLNDTKSTYETKKSELEVKWTNDVIYLNKLNINLDFTKSETTECLLENMADYLKNFKKNTKSSKVLEKNLNKSFDIENFDNDLSFGCYSTQLVSRSVGQ